MATLDEKPITQGDDQQYYYTDTELYGAQPLGSKAEVEAMPTFIARSSGGRKRRGKKSRKSRKGKKPRKGKKSRKNKRRTKRR